MSFIKRAANQAPINDSVFGIVALAKAAKEKLGNDKVIDATIGSLYGEDGNFVAMNTVFQSYDGLSSTVKGRYASDFTGNADYRKQVEHWVLGNHNTDLFKCVIATPGGTGAISACLDKLLDVGQTVIFPEIAWGTYPLMAEEKQLKSMTYSMFDGDSFHLASLQEVCTKIMEEQGKVVVVINDPCHNPTGYSMTKTEWQAVIAFLNALSEQGPCVIINDIAYIDFSYQGKHSRDYLDAFDAISDQVMVVIGFSSSKSLTSYGLRLGAALVMAKNQVDVRNVEIVMEKTARAIWSNVANAAMENFVAVTTTHLDAYEKEKDIYIDLLRQRSGIFVQEAEACNLPMYPYKEGFFVTIKVDDVGVRDEYHALLMKHLIFTVKVNKGIRIAICSISVNQSKGLAIKMKQLLDQSMNGMK